MQFAAKFALIEMPINMSHFRLCISFWLVALTCCSFATAVELVSEPSTSYVAPAHGNGDSAQPIISRDGRFVLFASTANNLAVNGNGEPYFFPHPSLFNVFLRDRNAGTTALASVDVADRAGASSAATPTGISTNGQFALFESAATNLVNGDTTNFTDVFVRDMVTRTTLLVSVATNGLSGRGSSADSVMTPDGRYVAFSSLANNLVPGDTNGISDVFVRDLQTGTTILASPGAQNTTAVVYTPGSDLPEITPDGRYVAFLSSATNLVAGITNVGEVYVRDLVNGTTVCVSTNAHQSFSNAVSYSHRISADGQYVAFEASPSTANKAGIIIRHNVQSGMDDLVSSNVSPASIGYKLYQNLDMTPDGRFIAYVINVGTGTGVMLWDAQSAVSTLISVSTNGGASTSGSVCDLPTIDETGNFVTFRSTSWNLTTNVASPFLGSRHIYRRDVQAGITKMIDVAVSGLMDEASPSVSPTARFVAYESPDVPTANEEILYSDVFLYDADNDATELISAHDANLTSRTSRTGNIRHGISASADGQFITYASTGNGIVVGYSNINTGIFLCDLINQTNALVSLTTNGTATANGASTEAVISGNGRYVAFTSFATNLVNNDTNQLPDIFIRDLQSGTNSFVSANVAGNGSGSGSSSSPSISFDGRYVLFSNNTNIFLRDRTLGTNYALTSSLGRSASMTPDGRYIACIGFIPGGLTANIYIWDSQVAKRIYTNTASAVTNVCISTNGQWIAYVAASQVRIVNRIANTTLTASSFGKFGLRMGLKFSDDARFLVYAGVSTNVVTPTTGPRRVYLFDSQTGANRLISERYASAEAASGDSDAPDISGDGRYVVYQSYARDIVPTDSNGEKDVFLYDQIKGTTTLLSVSRTRSDSAGYASLAPAFICDGQTIVFHSFASDITDNDFNEGDDIFTLKLLSTNSVSQTNAPTLVFGQVLFAPGSGQPGSSPALTWQTIDGASYQVVYKDELTDATWQPLNGNVTIVGNQAQAIDFAPNPNHRFYRLVVN